MSLRVEPMDGPFGARVLGVDLAAGIDDTEFAAIRRALFDRHVVAIPGQTLSAGALVAFSRRFGPLEPHLLEQYHHPTHAAVLMLSNWHDADGNPKGVANPPDPIYHTDLSYRPRPTSVTLLYALRVPAGGGDTLFVDMVEAYNTLPDALRDRLDGLRARHNYAYRYPERLTPEQRAALDDVVHPAIRIHPETGARAIFVNPSFTGSFVDLSDEASDALKAAVFAHCLQPRFELRYRWSDGDLVMWDNAAVMHSATPAPDDQERTLMRTTVVGSVPR